MLTSVLVALALGACSAAESDPAFGAKVRAYLVENPEVLEEAFAALEQKRTQTAAASAKVALTANRAKLERDPRDPVLGRPDAPITVVEFFDYRCGFCKVAAPQVLKLAETEPDVRFVMKELPILADRDTGVVGVSDRAARVALLAKANGRYPAVHQALMAERALDAAAVDRIARANGVNPDAGATPALDRQIAETAELAQAIGVEGTPAFIVGDRVIPGADIPALRQAIAEARKAR